jgi:hypothetical protein
MSSAAGADDVDLESYLGYPNARASQVHLLVTAVVQAQSDDPAVELSSRKKIACGRSCKGSHLGYRRDPGYQRKRRRLQAKKTMRKLRRQAKVKPFILVLSLCRMGCSRQIRSGSCLTVGSGP